MKEQVMIVAAVQNKDESKALDAALEAGASGVTYFYGKGTGVRQKLGFLGSLIEAEKTVLLMCCPKDGYRDILKAVREAVALDKPGKGFACVLPVLEAVGVSDPGSSQG